MLRTAAHCVHVLTLPIENSMLAQWRTFIARADNSCVSFMELALIYFLWNYQQLWTKVYTSAYHWKAYDSKNAMVHTEMSGHYVKMSALIHKWASMSVTERTCFIMSVKQFFEQLNTFESKSAKIVFPFAHHWASLLINERVYMKLCKDSKKSSKVVRKEN